MAVAFGLAWVAAAEQVGMVVPVEHKVVPSVEHTVVPLVEHMVAP